MQVLNQMQMMTKGHKFGGMWSWFLCIAHPGVRRKTDSILPGKDQEVMLTPFEAWDPQDIWLRTFPVFFLDSPFFFQKPILKGTAAGSQQAGKQASQPAKQASQQATKQPREDLAGKHARMKASKQAGSKQGGREARRQGGMEAGRQGGREAALNKFHTNHHEAHKQLYINKFLKQTIRP